MHIDGDAQSVGKTYRSSDLGAVLLQVHDGVRDFHVDGIHDRLNVERSLKTNSQLVECVW